MKTIYGVLAATLLLHTCHGMQQKEKINLIKPATLCHLTQKNSVSKKNFNIFGEHNNEPQKYKFHEFAQEKKLSLEPSLELSNGPLQKEFLIKEQKPVSQGLWGYLWSKVPSLPSLPSLPIWSTKQESQDWKNPLVVKNDDFPGISAWFLTKNQYVPLQGPGIFILFDAKSGKKIIDWRDSSSQQTPLDIYNVHMTHAAVLADNKAFIYNIRNGGEPTVIPFEKSARFVQHTTDNHFVIVNTDNLVVYDLIHNRSRKIELSSAINSHHWIQRITPYSLVIECNDGSVYFINPCDDYKLTEIEHENHFEIPMLVSVTGAAPNNCFAARVDNELRLYDIATGKQEYAGIFENGDIFAEPIFMSKDNRLFATTTVSCTRKGVLIYNVNAKKPIFIDLVGDNRDAIIPLFSSDNAYVSYMLDDINDPKNSVWRCHSTKDGTLVHEEHMEFNGGSIRWISQSPFFVYLQEKTLFSYDASSGGSVILNFEEIKSRFMNDSLVVACKDNDLEGIFFTFKGDNITPQNFVTDEPFTLVGSAFNNDGTKFALATDTKFYIYDVASGRYLKRFDQQPGDKIQSFDFSTTDYFTALGTETVRVFNQNSFDLLHILSFKQEGIKDGQFSSEKKIFVVRTEQSLNFYYMHNGVAVKI